MTCEGGGGPWSSLRVTHDTCAPTRARGARDAPVSRCENVTAVLSTRAVPVIYARDGRISSAQSAAVVRVAVRGARSCHKGFVPRGTLCAAHTCSSGGRARARRAAPKVTRARPGRPPSRTALGGTVCRRRASTGRHPALGRARRPRRRSRRCVARPGMPRRKRPNESAHSTCTCAPCEHTAQESRWSAAWAQAESGLKSAAEMT